MVERSGSVVFADSQRTAGVATKLIVPHYTHDNQDWSIGGVMCVPLKGLVISGVKFDLTSFPKLTDYGLVLAIDTGSEGFFVIDDTGSQDQPSVTDIIAENQQPIGDGTGEYSIIIGTNDGKDFVIRNPEQWRTGDLAEVIRRRPFRTAEPAGPNGLSSAGRSQMFMVGNAWLQAIAVTFCPRAGLVYFAHLDKDGNRAKGYLGPESPPKASSTAALSASQLAGDVLPSNKLPPFWQHTGYLGASLTEISYPVATAAPGAPPPSTDLELPITFMSSMGPGTDQRAESKDPSRLSEPCLTATFPLVGGGTRQVTQVLDTGSGISIVMGGTSTPQVSVSADSCPECGCVGTGGQAMDLVSLFRAYNPGADVPKRCTDPSREAQCGKGCCSQCCLGEFDVAGNPLGAQTQIKCAVSYCTGMLQYAPSFAFADFSPSFKNIRVFLARGTPVCEPAVSSGLWGCWFWANQEKIKGNQNKDDIIQHSSTLPFYVLRAMQQESGEMANMTFKFWRSDLQACASSSDSKNKTSGTSNQPSTSQAPPLPPSSPSTGDMNNSDLSSSGPSSSTAAPPCPPCLSPTPSQSGCPSSSTTSSTDANPPLSSKPRRAEFTAAAALEEQQQQINSLSSSNKNAGDASVVSWSTVGLVMVVVCVLLFGISVVTSLWRIAALKNSA